jgi:hypothetical protein
VTVGTYGLEGRNHWFVLAFAGARALGSTLQPTGNNRELFGERVKARLPKD